MRGFVFPGSGSGAGRGARRRTGPLAVFWLAACLVVWPVAPWTNPLLGQPPAEDDPFADELNPLGKPSTPKPPQPPKPTPTPGTETRPAPTPTLPVPFPDTTEPGPPAERPTTPRRDRVRLEPRDGEEGWEPSPAEKLTIEAEALDKAGDLAGARDKLREAIKADPRYSLAASRSA